MLERIDGHRDSLVSAWPEFDLKDADDGPMVGGLDAGAARVLHDLYVVGLSAPEHDAVLWTQRESRHVVDSFSGLHVAASPYCV